MFCRVLQHVASIAPRELSNAGLCALLKAQQRFLLLRICDIEQHHTTPFFGSLWNSIQSLKEESLAPLY